MNKLIILLALVLVGCSHRENAKAAIQTQQAIVASQQILRTHASELPKEFYDHLSTLLTSANTSIEPVIADLSADENIKVDTTVDEAINSPKTFERKAIKQAARAGIESENNAAWSSMLPSEDILSMLMLALTGTGGAGLVVAKLLQVYKRSRDALEDQVAYTKDRVAAKTPEEVDAIKEKHAARQTKRGTKTIIERSLNVHKNKA